MKIAILTSGILPVPAVQGGAVEILTDHYLEYNDLHRLHDMTVFSVYHPLVDDRRQRLSAVNHYRYIDTSSLPARVRKQIFGLTHKDTYYHYSIDYFFRQALRSIQQEDYDCIVIENRPGYALGLRGKTRAKLVYHLHNDFLNSSTRNAKEIYQAADKILTVSDYIRGRVQTCCEQDTKTVTLHNGIDLAPFSAKPSVSRQFLGFADDDFILLFSGRLVSQKGILELIEAMNLLKDLPKVRLLVMGSSFYGNASQENDFIRELKARATGLEERIRFTGYVKHELIADYLRLADVAVAPSTWEEPFGLTVLEGMAAGLPIITTNRGGIPEMVTKDNAVVVPFPGDGDFIANLADAIRSLYHDKDALHRMGKVSLQLSAQYTKERYARNFFEKIKE